MKLESIKNDSVAIAEMYKLLNSSPSWFQPKLCGKSATQTILCGKSATLVNGL